MIQPYTPDDLERGEQVVKELHSFSGFEAWAEHIAKELAAERERCAKIAENWKSPLRPHTEERLRWHYEASSEIAYEIRMTPRNAG